VIGGKDDPVEGKAGVAGGVVIQRDVLAGGREVPQHLVVRKAVAGQGNIPAEVDVAVEGEVEDHRVSRPVAVDRHELPVVLAVGCDVEDLVLNATEGARGAGAFVDRLVPADGDVGPRQPTERAAETVDGVECGGHGGDAVVDGGGPHVTAVAV